MFTAVVVSRLEASWLQVHLEAGVPSMIFPSGGVYHRVMPEIGQIPAPGVLSPRDKRRSSPVSAL
jgi:hypothetical protein